MAIQRILAMTAEEISAHSTPPPAYALMGCYFSADGSELVGLPRELPKGCGIVIDDRNPIPQTDEVAVANVLSSSKPAYVILDFQRSPTDIAKKLAKELVNLPCPVAMPPEYAKGLDCPLFLPPVPPNIPVEKHLIPWKSHEVWLELALDAVEITVTAQGSQSRSFPHTESKNNAHKDSMLCCHYIISQQQDSLHFYCYRTQEDVEAMLRTPLPGNLTHAVGLFRELGSWGK